MKYNRQDGYNVLGIGVFLLVLLGVWVWGFARIQRQNESTAKTNALLNEAADRMLGRPLSANELTASKRTNLDLPYNICYIPDVNDPTRWNARPDSVTATSPIVRQTIAVASQQSCDEISGVDTIVFDLRKNAATINAGFHTRADEVIKKFLEESFPGIWVDQNSIFKNLRYGGEVGKEKFYLSIGAVYRTVQGKYDLLLQNVEVNSTGVLQKPSNFSLTRRLGNFNQINRQGTTTVLTKEIHYVFLSARSSSADTTLSVYIKPMRQDLLTTLSLSPTATYSFVVLPEQAEEPRLFLNVEGPGKVEIDSFFSLKITKDGSLMQLSHKNVIYKLFTFNPLTTAVYTTLVKNSKYAYFRPNETEIREGILRKYSPLMERFDPSLRPAFDSILKAMNNDDMRGAYIVPQLAKPLMNCEYYTRAEVNVWKALAETQRANQSMVRDPLDPGVFVGSSTLYWRTIFSYAFFNFSIYTLKYYPRNGGRNVENPAVAEFKPYNIDVLRETPTADQCQSIEPGETFT